MRKWWDDYLIVAGQLLLYWLMYGIGFAVATSVVNEKDLKEVAIVSIFWAGISVLISAFAVGIRRAFLP